MIKRSYRVLGIMSGTSLDGIDLCYSQFDFSGHIWQFQILKACTFPYTQKWRTRLQFTPHLKATELLELDHWYGKLLASKVTEFLSSEGIPPGEVDLIASHGHTLYHQPAHGYTLQIGNGAELFAGTGLPVVCDFRKQDVALGGQGAPLVPVGDELLFSEYDACLNLGGFANISFSKGEQRIAFDICPVNFVLNELCQKIGKTYDEDGAIARLGNCHHALLNKLDALPFYQKVFPKSLGAEWVRQYVNPLLSENSITIEDKISTFTYHVAEQIAKVLHNEGLKSCLITGGGAYNSFIIDLIRERSGLKIDLPDSTLIEFKEALIFGLMGVLRIRGETNILSSVTGSHHDHSSGIIYGPLVYNQ